jgi:hypothetical protein
MTDLRKAAEMALEALEWNYGTDLENIENCMAWLEKMNATIQALRQALEQSEWQELNVNEVIQLISENITDPSPELLQELYSLMSDVDMYLQEKNSGS